MGIILSSVDVREIRELHRSAKICDICHSSIVYKYCTRKNQQTSVFRNIQGSFGYETQNLHKKDWIRKCYVSCLKLEYFFKSCKTLPLNGYYV